MKRQFKSVACLFFCLLLVFTWLPVTARADTGPKPSVHITFENFGDELCYGTLLSDVPSTGPHSVWDGSEEFAYHNENERYPYVELDYKTWKAFVDYQDTDGFYFLQHAAWQVNETKELTWGYYPPQKFKILLYFPETEQFIVSGICQRYAFDSYFTFDVSASSQHAAEKSYQYGPEILSLFARILITIAIEMGIAFLFGFRDKKSLLFLVIVNTITQVILNVCLNVINFCSGQQAFEAAYLLFELGVFAIEAVLYCVFMKKLTDCIKPIWFYIVYALIANGVSFVLGLQIAKWIPGIF